MKPGFHGLRARGLSFLTIILMCTTVFIWTWKRTPILSTSPHHSRFEITPDVRWSVPMADLEKRESAIALETDSEEQYHRETSLVEETYRKEEFRNEEERNTERDDVETLKGSGNRDWDSRLVEETDKKEEFRNEEKRKDERKEGETGKGEESKGNGNRKNEKAQPPLGYVQTSSKRSNVTACNYSKGKWVVDNNQSVYSGFGCKLWLSEMWSCRLTRRTDFAYENLRWQPKECQLERFEGSKFLKRMQNKTLAFVGDSLGRQQFQSLICMITGGNEQLEITDVGENYGIALAQGHTRPDGWAFHFPSTNTTVLYYWSASLCDIQPIDTQNMDTTDYAMHLDRPASFLTRNIHRLDVVVLNTAHHWNRGKLRANRWVMHVGGEINNKKHLQEMGKARNLTVHSVVRWAESQLNKYHDKMIFYRTISPRHFVGGDWNSGGSCDNTNPMSIGKEVDLNESSDSIAASAVKGTRVKLLDITALSALRDEAHISRFRGPPNSTASDCLHWCLPGVPDSWNEILFAQL